MTWLPSLTSPLRVAEGARRRLALCLDVVATACLIAGMAAILAVADTRTFGVSRVYVVAVVATAPILGVLYVIARRMSADPHAVGAEAAAKTPRRTPYTGRELRRRLTAWVIDLVVWICALNVVLLPGNLVLVLNRWLDRSKPVDVSFVVQGKKWLHKDKRAYFVMPRVGTGARESVPVSTALYDRIVLDRTKVVLTMHDGALGFRWTRPAELRWADLAPPS